MMKLQEDGYVSQSSALSFEVLPSLDVKPLERSSRARLGVLRCAGRKTTNTPHYVAITSRGSVPHVTPDMVEDEMDVRGVYVALEDCKSASGQSSV